MSRVRRYLLERLTALDLNLAARFGRRELARVTTGLSVLRGLGIRGSAVADSQDRSPLAGRNLRGLEVTWTSGIGWNVLVSAGACLLAWTGTDETRPGTWSGKVESDDGSFAVGVLPASVQAVPSSAPGGALVGYEYWLVYATVSEAAIETDSASKVFNEGTGVYDSASATKVSQQKLAITVLRGSSNSAPPFSSLPGGSVLLGMLFVPSGATDLSAAVIFDCRKLPELAPGPNRVGGQWQFAFEGQNVSPFGETIFKGRVHARLGGELLGARVYPDGLTVGKLAEPGATWDATASTSTPKIAWLYLCKPGGVVPRPVRRGQSPIAHDGSYTSDSTLIEGALVLSPTPPRIGASVTAAEGPKSGLRWDLRPSATLTLPGFANGTLDYQYGGLTVSADNAICVGFIRYSDVDAGTPVLHGSLHVDEAGWMRGSSIYSGDLNPSGLFTLPTMTANNSATPRTYTSGLYGFATITIGGVDFPLPLDGAELLIQVGTSGTGYDVAGSGEDAGQIYPLHAGNLALVDLQRRQVTPGRPNLNQIKLTLSTNTFTSDLVTLRKVKFPYGEDLVT